MGRLIPAIPACLSRANSDQQVLCRSEVPKRPGTNTHLLVLAFALYAIQLPQSTHESGRDLAQDLSAGEVAHPALKLLVLVRGDGLVSAGNQKWPWQ